MLVKIKPPEVLKTLSEDIRTMHGVASAIEIVLAEHLKKSLGTDATVDAQKADWLTQMLFDVGQLIENLCHVTGLGSRNADQNGQT